MLGFLMHAARKGPGRMGKTSIFGSPGFAGAKLVKKMNAGTCGLRNRVGAAGRLALEGKLGLEYKKMEASRIKSKV